MTTRNLSVLAAKKRVRPLLREIERLDGELMNLLQALPGPSLEDFAAMLRIEAPLTPEAALLGRLQLGHFYLAEAVEVLSVALAVTPRSLRHDWPTRPIPLDILRSLRRVLEERAAASRRGQEPGERP